jgi:hypothetical protein
MAAMVLAISPAWVTGNEQRSPMQTKAAELLAALSLSWAGCDAGKSAAARARNTTRCRNGIFRAAASSGPLF